MAKTTRKNRKHASWKNVSRRRAFKPITLTAEVDGRPAFLTVADEISGAAVKTYMDAHKLLPRTQEEAERTQQPTIGDALAILEDDCADADARLHAIVILGHAPAPWAHEALERYAASGRVHADVAWVAADECASWMGNLGQSGEAQASPLN